MIQVSNKLLTSLTHSDYAIQAELEHIRLKHNHFITFSNG